MEYFLIKGQFRVVGHSPDGDSLKFEATDASQWDKIQSEFREPFQENFQKEKGSVQLRLQGVDALETHYSPMPVPAPKALGNKTFAGAEKPAPGRFSQPGEIGRAATDKLLELLGVVKANWNGPHTFIKSIEVKNGTKLETISETGKERLEGYIVVNDFEQKGRPISWAFVGPPPAPDGSQIPLPQLLNILKTSANYRLLAAGLVYPRREILSFYPDCPSPLRKLRVSIFRRFPAFFDPAEVRLLPTKYLNRISMLKMTLLKTAFLLFAVFFSCVQAAFGQAKVRGLVTDETGQPLAAANVLLLNPADSSTIWPPSLSSWTPTRFFRATPHSNPPFPTT